MAKRSLRKCARVRSFFSVSDLMDFSKRRKNLMKEDPHCHWCRRPLSMGKSVPNGGPLPEDYPTIDHLNDRINNRIRPKEPFSVVIACRACNEGRANTKIANMKWTQRWKSGTFPGRLKFVGYLLRWWRGELTRVGFLRYRVIRSHEKRRKNTTRSYNMSNLRRVLRLYKLSGNDSREKEPVSEVRG